MKYIEEPEPMREIHAIREKHYEETKNLSTAELLKKIHSDAQKAIKKYKINVRSVSEDDGNVIFLNEVPAHRQELPLAVREKPAKYRSRKK